MKRMLMTAAMLAGGILLLAGCPGKNSEAKLESRKLELKARIKEYTDCFFWRDFEKAANYIVPEKRGEFFNFADRLKKGFTMEDFLVKVVEVNEAGDQAGVIVRRSYILGSSVTVQEEDFTQQWVLRDGVWYLSGPPY